MVIIIVGISFFLDGLLSIYQTITLLDIAFFRPMFTIVALSFVYLWCLKDPKYYYKVCLFTGLAYDLLYTNTFPLNVLLFLLLGLIIEKLYTFFKASIIRGIIINLIIITAYHIITFTILYLIGYLSFNYHLFLNNFLGIIITNSIFYAILYLFFRRDKKKKMYRL